MIARRLGLGVSNQQVYKVLKAAGLLQKRRARTAELYQAARLFEFLPQAPVFGHGAGSWPVLWRGFDRHDTPHNMVLEVLVETGIVGLVLMIALLVVALRPVSIDRLRNDPLALCAFMLFVWLVLKAQLGPDLADNRLMFMMLGVLTGLMGRRGAPSPAAPAGAALRTVPPLARQAPFRPRQEHS